MSRDVFEALGNDELSESVFGLLLGYTLCCLIAFLSWAVLAPPLALLLTLLFFALFRMFLLFYALISNRILNNRLSIIWAVSVVGQMIERHVAEKEFLSLPHAMSESDHLLAQSISRKRSGSILIEYAIDVALMFACAVAGLVSSSAVLSGISLFARAVRSFFGDL